jgi:hypothetical protein
MDILSFAFVKVGQLIANLEFKLISMFGSYKSHANQKLALAIELSRAGGG